MPARDMPIASLWIISAVLCLSPRTLPIVWCIPRHTSKVLNFDTCNSPVGMHLHHCVCRATLQISDTDPQQRTKYGGSHLIIPHGAQYNNHLFPTIVEPWNHCGPSDRSHHLGDLPDGGSGHLQGHRPHLQRKLRGLFPVFGQ